MNDLLLCSVEQTAYISLAPVRDLRMALMEGSLGALNPFPFSFMCGNCLGWTVYGYYQHDAFLVAANLPGLILSVWLNSGASKLQYLALSEARKQQAYRHRERWDASNPMGDSSGDDNDDNDSAVLLSDAEWKEMEESFVTVPQERALLRVLTVWTIVIVYVSWFSRGAYPSYIIGVVVNLNLIAFYGAPLQTMHTVITTKNSESIHVPTMIMNWLNTSFWIAYGFARRDAVIIAPNSIGLCLGLAQGVLKALYPSRPSPNDVQAIPQHAGGGDDDNGGSLRPEEERPGSSQAVNRRIHATRMD